MEVRTIANCLELFLADLSRKLRSNSFSAYRSDLRLAAAHFVNIPVDKITLAQLEVFLNQSNLTWATVNRRVSSLKRFFKWAIKNKLCATNPLDHFEARRTTRRLPRPVGSRADLELIDQAIARSEQPYRLIFNILRETGMRVGEVLALSIEDVCLDRGREGLRIREAKNGRERLCILGADATPKTLRGLRAWLRDLKGQPSFTPLFVSNRGTRLSYSAMQYQWTLLCKKGNQLESDGSLRYTIHQLRHTRGSELVRQGVRLEVVQRVLGHCDIRSTQGYAELDDLEVRETLAHLNQR
jgi:integrase/recombinase XerD